ncbi:hypothetical protein ASG31_09225 [Chryseobacterium sp. Leaf404]|uniref:hypothetical protein n=1 Tax=unclassified Chryseobacterium TaxID=2593645 RepID=UPI0006F4FD54|nr:MULTISPECIES: hypothetical protein [unclassified Chryseobacterium]KQT17697.1 hypothetical protein ASG31_09225 [Chryseobacterium sp. Leaf404]
MYYKTIILSLGFLSLTNCKSQKAKSDVIKAEISEIGDVKTTTKEGEIIYLKEGENKFLKEYQMNVTFKGISEDSRCPKDVQCIWSGVAVAQVEVMATTSRPVTLQISSIENKAKNYHKSADFNGYTISLADVNPYPESSKGTKDLKGNYKIGIIIKKAGENTTTR